MKNIKYVLLGVVITLILFVIYNIVLTLTNYEESVNLSKNETYESIMKSNDDTINKLSKKKLSEKNIECLNSIKDLYDYSMSTYKIGKISKRKYLKETIGVESDKSPLSYYFETHKKCEFEEESRLVAQILTIQMFYENVYDEYTYNYEMTMSKSYFKDITKAEEFKLFYPRVKDMEAYLVSDALEILGGSNE